jgi:ubiquinone/menaquinone biosynthesis C-methylase UbiE
MPEFDAYHRHYEQTIDRAISYIGKPQQFFTIVKADYLSELFLRRFGSEREIKVLDIGCGNARIHPFLLERCPHLRLRGIDVASTSVEAARQAHPQVQYDVYDGTKLPYNTGQFDAAYTICVMHHVSPSQWPAFIADMCRVVRPGGMVSVIEHNPFNPLTRLLVNTCPYDQNANLLRASQLSKFMRNAGLKEIERRFIQFTPFEGHFFKRFDRFMGWLPLGAQYLTTARVPADRQ